MKVLVRISACFILFTTTANACDLDDCALPKALHQIDGKATPAHGIWTWLHHDLALTREAIRRGNQARALTLAKQLDQVLRVRLDDLLRFSEPDAVRDFHATLAGLVTSAGGWPLKEIDIGGREAQG